MVIHVVLRLTDLSDCLPITAPVAGKKVFHPCHATFRRLHGMIIPFCKPCLLVLSGTLFNIVQTVQVVITILRIEFTQHISFVPHPPAPCSRPVPEPAEGVGEGWRLFGLQARLPPEKSWFRPSPFKEKEIKDEVFIESSMLYQPDKRIYY
jgi:hypothetical protein